MDGTGADEEQGDHQEVDQAWSFHTSEHKNCQAVELTQ